MNVFHQITNPDDASKNPNPLMLLNLREPLPPSGNSASLLFHYLSDDWQTSYKLVAREEYAYGRRLDDLVSGLSRQTQVKLDWSVRINNDT